MLVSLQDTGLFTLRYRVLLLSASLAVTLCSWYVLYAYACVSVWINRSLIIGLASSKSKTVHKQIMPTSNLYSYNLNLDFSSPSNPLAMKSYRGATLIQSFISSRTSEWNIANRIVYCPHWIGSVFDFYSTILHKPQRRGASTSALYSGVPGSNLGPEIGNAVLTLFVAILNPSRPKSGYYLKLGAGRLLLQPFQLNPTIRRHKSELLKGLLTKPRMNKN
jgi:hypothetical protein